MLNFSYLIFFYLKLKEKYNVFCLTQNSRSFSKDKNDTPMLESFKNIVSFEETSMLH